MITGRIKDIINRGGEKTSTLVSTRGTSATILKLAALAVGQVSVNVGFGFMAPLQWPSLALLSVVATSREEKIMKLADKMM